MACVLSAIRIALFCVDVYKTELEIKLTELLGASVKIDRLHAHLRRGLKPELVLKKITLSDKNARTKPTIQLKEIRLGIDLMAVVTQQHIIPATWMTLVGAKLSVIHKPDGRFVILGLQSGDEQPVWLLKGQRYELLQSEITWWDEKNHRPPYTFTHVDIALKNEVSKQHHQLNWLSQLPTAYGDTLRISADFSGDFFKSNTLNAELFVAGKNLHFSKLPVDELPLKLAIKAGSGDFELWATVKNSQLTALMGEIDTKSLTLQRPDWKKLQLKQFNSRFQWRNQVDSWDLAVDNLAIAIADKIYQPAPFYLGSPHKIAEQFRFNTKQLDLELVQMLTQFFVPTLNQNFTDLNNLTYLAMKGQLSDTSIFADLKQYHFNINGKFAHLSIALPAPYPQLHNFSGEIQGNEQQGVLSLKSHNSQLTTQPLFRTPLAIKQLTGKLHWRQEQKNWYLSAVDLKLNTPYAQSISRLNVTLPKDSQPVFMDLQTAFFNLNDVSKAKEYFPVTLMSKNLLHYLDEAFISGHVKRGDLLLYGYLKDFPFKKREGVFQVLFNAQDVTLKYAENWPFFEHLDARILFEDESLTVNLKRAQVEPKSFASLKIDNAKITIPSFSESDYILVQEVLARAEINEGLSFLRHTPLSLPLESVSQQLTIAGDTHIALALKIPLIDGFTPHVEGSVRVSAAKLHILAIDLPIHDLTGVFRFTEDGFYSDTLHALGLGYPLEAKIAYTPENTLINVDGRVGIKELQQQFELPAQTIAQGASNYNIQLTLPFTEKSSPQLIMHSNLQGIALNLPDSLAKTENETKDLKLTFNLSDSPILPVNLNYDSQFKANVLMHKSQKSVVAGTVVWGKGDVQMPTSEQFKIKINQPRFSASSWLMLLANTQVSSDKTQLLTDLEIYTPQLDWSGQSLGRFDLMMHHNMDDWRGTLDCEAAKGRLFIPQNTGTLDNKIKLDMEYIDLSDLMRLNLPKKFTSTGLPTRLPLFEIKSEKLLLRDINLGKLTLDSERSAQGITFKNSLITPQERNLSLTGDWQVVNHREITHLNGELMAENFGELLKKLQLNEDLKETDAKINLALQWAGAPYQFSLTTLSGLLDIHLDEGRISSIEPGVGRLLGVLAMEQWLKRLQLDFSDIYKEGLTFNEITGHFLLHDGVATTENLTVDAVAATINVSGSINLPQQTLNQYITVIPKSSSAIPIAGTIMGSIATVMAQTITGEYEEGYYLRSKYRVKGKWNNLNVMPLHEQDGLFKKIGRGLTDFSWITQPEQD